MAKIVILELNQVFDSLTAAARAVGVDVSNARKAVKGLRQSAGGYHFAEVSGQADIARARENVVKQKTKRTKKRIVDKAKRSLIDAVHDRLVDVNKRARNAKKADLLDKDPVLQKMLSHTDFFGGNKTGGYKTSKTHLRQFSTNELQNLLDMLAADQHGYYDEVYNNKSKNRNLASYAAQFGISIPEAKKYWYVFPAIFELFRVAKQSEMTSSDPTIVAEIYDAMQGDADPEDLLDYVLDLTNYYKGNTSEDLDAILDKWSTTRGSWADEWEEF